MWVLCELGVGVFKTHTIRQHTYSTQNTVHETQYTIHNSLLTREGKGSRQALRRCSLRESGWRVKQTLQLLIGVPLQGGAAAPAAGAPSPLAFPGRRLHGTAQTVETCVAAAAAGLAAGAGCAALGVFTLGLGSAACVAALIGTDAVAATCATQIAEDNGANGCFPGGLSPRSRELSRETRSQSANCDKAMCWVVIECFLCCVLCL